MTFDYLSWEAFATLVTGALAVLAAAFVGLRQAEIQRRQAEIQHRQATTVGYAHRLNLFERRLAIFQAIQNYVTQFIRDRHGPYVGEVYEAYRKSVQLARFVFPESVWREVLRIDQLMREHDAQRSIAEQPFREDWDKAQAIEASEARRRSNQTFKDVLVAYEALPKTFGSALSLEG